MSNKIGPTLIDGKIERTFNYFDPLSNIDFIELYEKGTPKEKHSLLKYSAKSVGLVIPPELTVYHNENDYNKLKEYCAKCADEESWIYKFLISCMPNAIVFISVFTFVICFLMVLGFYCIK